jgi:hypothetical protein
LPFLTGCPHARQTGLSRNGEIGGKVTETSLTGMGEKADQTSQKVKADVAFYV